MRLDRSSLARIPSDTLAEVESDLERQRSELVTRYRYDNIIGHSAPMKRLFGVLDRVTDTGVPILIQGESGTGKELVARATHYNSAGTWDKPGEDATRDWPTQLLSSYGRQFLDEARQG